MQTFENHLKAAYSVRRENEILSVTDTSCYFLNEETRWLISVLPPVGEKDLYLRSLESLGIEEPVLILERLVAIGVLREKVSMGFWGGLRKLVSPRIQLLSSKTQEKLFGAFPFSSTQNVSVFKLMGIIAAAAIGWGLFSILTGPEKFFWASTTGNGNLLVVSLIVVLGSMVHELGHSFASMSAGIGFRPISFSVYLVYPVFCVNVSGIERVGFVRRLMIDMGGVALQGVFLLGLLMVAFLVNSQGLVEAAGWITVIILFNLNPFFRTDGYWLYKDIFAEFKNRRIVRVIHHFYVVVFMLFSVFFLWRIGGWMGEILNDMKRLWESPEHFFSGGYRLFFWAYFVLVGLMGGVRRFKEGRDEWRELKTTKATVS